MLLGLTGFQNRGKEIQAQGHIELKMLQVQGIIHYYKTRRGLDLNIEYFK